MLETRQSVLEDVAYLAPRLRDADLQELLAAGVPSAQTALEDGFRHSKYCISIVNDSDKAVAMFGCGAFDGDDVGYIWLLGSDEIKQHPTRFLRRSKVWIDTFHREFPILTNYVDQRNTVHLHWLRWLGFSMLRTVEMAGPGNHPFYEFARINHVR